MITAKSSARRQGHHPGEREHLLRRASRSPILKDFKAKYPLNSRVVKGPDGKLKEEVYRAGTPDGSVPPGLYAIYLKKANEASCEGAEGCRSAAGAGDRRSHPLLPDRRVRRLAQVRPGSGCRTTPRSTSTMASSRSIATRPGRRAARRLRHRHRQAAHGQDGEARRERRVLRAARSLGRSIQEDAIHATDREGRRNDRSKPATSTSTPSATICRTKTRSARSTAPRTTSSPAAAALFDQAASTRRSRSSEPPRTSFSATSSTVRKRTNCIPRCTK